MKGYSVNNCLFLKVPNFCQGWSLWLHALGTKKT